MILMRVVVMGIVMLALGCGGSSKKISGTSGTGGASGAPEIGGMPTVGGGGTTDGGAGGFGGGAGTQFMNRGPIGRSPTSYVLEFADVYFEVNPMLGARVTDVHLRGGANMLGGTGDNSGSTFWPSPQSAWTWPPTDATSIANINDQPYEASFDSNEMYLRGMPSDAVGLAVTKQFDVNESDGVIGATYTINDTSGSSHGINPNQFAPWEITRFAQKGVTFYPTGSTPVAGNGMDLPPTTTGAACGGGTCTWLSAPASLPERDQKLLADGTGGWLAHAEDGWVIVKRFTDMPASMAAPGEAEIEIYLSSTSGYMEVEVQGPYGAVSAPLDDGLRWSVGWIVRALPAGVTATAGDQKLVDFVESLTRLIPD
jgi:hypothetical protein